MTATLPREAALIPTLPSRLTKRLQILDRGVEEVVRGGQDVAAVPAQPLEQAVHLASDLRVRA